jgi:hypothetical protein
MWVKVSPPSVDFQTPSPQPTLFRLLASPVPTQTMSGFGWNRAMLPMERDG